MYEVTVMQFSLSCGCLGFNLWQGPQISACLKYPDQLGEISFLCRGP